MGVGVDVRPEVITVSALAYQPRCSWAGLQGVTVTVAIDDLPIARIEARYEVKRGEDLLATGRTLHAFVSPDGKILRPPEDFSEKAREIFARVSP